MSWSPIEANVPWQKHMPLAGLSLIANTRSKASGETMIRSCRLSGDIGGSSGCSASLTPSRSATGTIRSRNQARLSQSRSAVIGPPRPGDGSSCSASNAVTSAPAAVHGRRRGPRPVVVGHEVPAEDADAVGGHVADQIDEAGQLPLAALAAVREGVMRDVALDDRQREAVVAGLTHHVVEGPADVRRIAGHEIAHPHLGGEPQRGVGVGRADEGDAHGWLSRPRDGDQRGGRATPTSSRMVMPAESRRPCSRSQPRSGTSPSCGA